LNESPDSSDEGRQVPSVDGTSAAKQDELMNPSSEIGRQDLSTDGTSADNQDKPMHPSSEIPTSDIGESTEEHASDDDESKKQCTLVLIGNYTLLYKLR
jgi:hypothetical protein